MRRLSNHIGTTVFASIGVALLVLIGLDAVGEIIDQSGRLGRNYHFPDALIYVGTLLPSRLYEFMPFGCLIGCLIGLGILQGNSEVVVMRAAGVSPLQVVGFVLKPVLVFIVLAMAIGEYFSPYLDQLAEGRREYLLKGESAQDSTTGFWNREGNEFMHFNAVFPGGVLYGVTRYRFTDDKTIEEASFSSRATYNAVEGYWTEENVSITRFYGDRTEVDKKITRHWDSELTPNVLTVNILPADALPIASLSGYIEFLRQQNANTADYEVAFWRKVLQPLIIIGLVLVGISFVFGPLRESTMGFRVFVGVVTGVTFRIVQDLLGPLSIVFGFPPFLAVITPVVFCAALGVYLLRRSG